MNTENCFCPRAPLLCGWFGWGLVLCTSRKFWLENGVFHPHKHVYIYFTTLFTKLKTRSVASQVQLEDVVFGGLVQRKFTWTRR